MGDFIPEISGQVREIRCVVDQNLCTNLGFLLFKGSPSGVEGDARFLWGYQQEPACSIRVHRDSNAYA